MNDTPERRKQVDFVDYLTVGQSLMVKAGNPEHITALASLVRQERLGRGRHDETATSSAPRAKLAKAGKKAITIKTFPKDTDAASALKTGKVDAYFGDSPVAAYYIKKDRVRSSSPARRSQPLQSASRSARATR